jgi:hypothetical protein
VHPVCVSGLNEGLPLTVSLGMKRLSVVIFVLLLCSLSHAQPGWERTYGGTGDDEGYSVQQTFDGGYIITGFSNSFGHGNDVYLIKTDASGDTLWTRSYDANGAENGFSVQQTSDSGYIIAGNASYYGDVWLIKTNASGDTLWTRTYGGSALDMSFSVQQTFDGGYIIAGATFSYGAGLDDVYLIKTDSSGDTLWARTYGGVDYDGAYSVRQTSDSGYILTGWTESFGAGLNDVYIIKTNAFGDTLWTRVYGGTSWDEGNSVQQTSDGGYIISGQTGSFGARYYSVYLIKTDASGDTLWTKTYGTGYQVGFSVQQTSEGGYIIAGETSPFGVGPFDVYLIKTDASGDTLWTRTYGGTGDDEGYSVQQTSDGGYIIAGFTNSFGAGNYDVYLIKTDSTGRVGVEVKKVSPPVRGFPFSVCPNPFISFAAVPYHESERFELYDISGRNVGTYKGNRIGQNLVPGVYFLRPLALTPRSSAPTLRIVKVR